MRRAIGLAALAVCGCKKVNPSMVGTDVDSAIQRGSAEFTVKSEPAEFFAGMQRCTLAAGLKVQVQAWEVREEQGRFWFELSAPVDGCALASGFVSIDQVEFREFERLLAANAERGSSAEDSLSGGSCPTLTNFRNVNTYSNPSMQSIFGCVDAPELVKRYFLALESVGSVVPNHSGAGGNASFSYANGLARLTSGNLMDCLSFVIFGFRAIGLSVTGSYPDMDSNFGECEGGARPGDVLLIGGGHWGVIVRSGSDGKWNGPGAMIADFASDYKYGGSLVRPYYVGLTSPRALARRSVSCHRHSSFNQAWREYRAQ